MRKIFTLLSIVFISVLGTAQVQTGTFVVSPNPFEENQQITVTVSGVNTATWGVTDLYLWTWSLDLNDTNSLDSPTNGTWTSSNEAQKMTNNGNGTFSFTFVPNTLYQRTGIGRIGMLVKAKDGTGDKKTQDFLIEVGAFQFTLTNPTSTTTVLNSGQTLTVSGNASLAANFELKANSSVVNTQNNLTNYTFTTAGLTQNTSFELKVTAVADPTKIITKTFDVVIAPTVTEAALPAGLLDGLNRNPTDPTKAT
ncbi:MAG: alpha-amylase, partial [Flavobacteriaceae bacterium]|nr:alpha-amylase [Flavobacteriaceae bacterium]